MRRETSPKPQEAALLKDANHHEVPSQASRNRHSVCVTDEDANTILPFAINEAA